MPTNDPVNVFQFIDMHGPDDCWPWLGAWGGRPGKERRPYFMANHRRTMAYRWVWELVKGQRIESDQSILHSCDNGSHPIGCCNPAHLSLGTHNENMQDMKERERHGLSHFVVRNIRRLISEGRPQTEIAALYGVSRETISAIATRRVYDHVQDELDQDNDGEP